jgi:hypothetical protein
LVRTIVGTRKSHLMLTALGNFIGPLVFLQEEKPLYTTGWIVTVSPTSLMKLNASGC